ncbi:MAG: GNAT family N-acetyltransferase [Paludibacteraceae bacterium]
MFLENELLKLRAPEPEDLELLYRWENDATYWIAGNTRSPYSKFQLKAYISQAKNDIYSDGALRLMIQEKSSGIAVGTVDLFDFDMHHSRVALGLFVASEHQGKGFASQSLALVEDYVFHFLKINQLYVQIAENNSASRKLFENRYELNGFLKNWLKTSENFVNILTYQKFK